MRLPKAVVMMSAMGSFYLSATIPCGCPVAALQTVAFPGVVARQEERKEPDSGPFIGQTVITLGT